MAKQNGEKFDIREETTKLYLENVISQVTFALNAITDGIEKGQIQIDNDYLPLIAALNSITNKLDNGANQQSYKRLYQTLYDAAKTLAKKNDENLAAPFAQLRHALFISLFENKMPIQALLFEQGFTSTQVGSRESVHIKASIATSVDTGPSHSHPDRARKKFESVASPATGGWITYDPQRKTNLPWVIPQSMEIQNAPLIIRMGTPVIADGRSTHINPIFLAYLRAKKACFPEKQEPHHLIINLQKRSSPEKKHNTIRKWLSHLLNFLTLAAAVMIPISHFYLTMLYFIPIAATAGLGVIRLIFKAIHFFKTWERAAEGVRSNRLENIDGNKYSTTTITLPADNDFLFRNFNRHTGKQTSNDKEQYESLQTILEELKDSIRNDKNDFFMPPEVKECLFDEHCKKLDERIAEVFQEAIQHILGGKPQDSINWEERTALLTYFKSAPLTQFIFEKLKPMTSNITCKDDVDRGILHATLYLYYMKGVDSVQDIDTLTQTAATVVKYRPMNSHNKNLHNIFACLKKNQIGSYDCLGFYLKRQHIAHNPGERRHGFFAPQDQAALVPELHSQSYSDSSSTLNQWQGYTGAPASPQSSSPSTDSSNLSSIEPLSSSLDRSEHRLF